ncbi:DNA repair protein RecO [Paraglaciecola aquimarina]|uniref:DNA repair protein RecO n=1 Tax=Paraglaciecola algarum TaxID=3050085 RepID=A0ABS9D615_9ALTE|nr:DNA repair protein RecO [Paraglaciecola sp. G1-23]MCF2948363.1 DNA repair protein RecO [Paraglaciecola sp. G1-23]
MVSEQLHGFLLHRREYRETSYLTDFFTLELGKVSAVIKGVRGSKGDKKSLLQSFQPLLLNLSGKHELRNLNQLESSASMLRLAGHQLFSAMYLNELLNRLLPKEVPHPEIYALYQASLQMLQNLAPIEPCLRHFETSLLNDLGYGFDIQMTYDTGESIQPDLAYYFVNEQGIKQVEEYTKSGHQFTGQALINMSNQYWDPDSLQCAKRLNRMALSHILGSKPLKSRELFQQTWSKSVNQSKD